MKPGPSTSATASDGTQTLRRATAILQRVAAAAPRGATLSEIARAQGLARPTVHRLLKGLVELGLLDCGAADKRYHVGPLVHELTLMPTAAAAESARWRPVVESVARRTGATAYLMRRSGIEAVCLVKAEGHSVLRFVPVDVGQRRLLGVGAGATALLAALDDAHLAAVIDAVAPGLSPYPRLSAESLRTAVSLARRGGFAISQGTVVADGFGMGRAIPVEAGVPHLAISLAAHAATVTESALTAWKQVLAEAVLAS